FLGIVSTNLDEFFMVRVAGLAQQRASGIAEPSADGMLPAEQLAAIALRVHATVAEQHRVWREEIVPLLAARGIILPPVSRLSNAQRSALLATFRRTVLPILTPLAVDPGHPFPRLKNKSLTLAVTLRRGTGPRRAGTRRRRGASPLVAVVQLPAMLPRLYPIPSSSEARAFVLLEDVIAA